MTHAPHNLLDLTLPQLETLLAEWGQPAYRARQIWRRLYVNYTSDPQAMTELPPALRTRLAAETQIGTLSPVTIQQADDGLTRKALWRLPGGEVIESVLMIYPGRATVCVSTQAGCAMGCVFCATGRMGLLRNLSSGVVVEQVLWAARELLLLANERAAATDSASTDAAQWWAASDLDDGAFDTAIAIPARLTNVVFMGMGEPFANYDRWWAAVERLHDPQGLNIGARSLTVSTVGLVTGIRRLATESLPINLAISLHAPNDALRSALMPVNDRFPLAELLASVREYLAVTRRRVSFEYVLLQGQNDTPAIAAELAALLAEFGGMAHVNLIPWNPVPGMPLGRSDRRRVRAFQQVLHDQGIGCTVRVERGVAIAAACGQLAGAPIALQPV